MPQSAHSVGVTSPDGHLAFSFSLRDLGREKSCPHYQIDHTVRKQPLVLPSRLGLDLEGASSLVSHFEVLKTETFEAGPLEPSKSAKSFVPLYSEGMNDPEYDHWKQLSISLRETIPPHRLLTIVVRAYNSGIAVRTVVPAQPAFPGTFVVGRERTQMALPPGTIGYECLYHEDEFRPTPIENLKPECWLPFTARLGEKGPYLCVTETADAATGDYAQTLLSPVGKSSTTLTTVLRGPVAAKAPFGTPWRLLRFADTPGGLVEANCILNTLVSPPAKDAGRLDWVRPGKAIREVTLSTKGGKACIDFAKANGLQYILYDAGWYGSEYDEASDARGVNLDPERVKPNSGHPGLDLKEVIAYGKEHGVGVFLYVNRRALERQLHEIIPLYHSWGVAGIKFGFVNVGAQGWTRWLREAVALCAQHHLLIDIHDAYRPVGLSGLYPNLLTQEGIRGNEHFPTSRHNCTLPFTRFLGGAGDYTVCYRNAKLVNTDAHQMALSVIGYSPLQLIYWYNQPGDYVGLPELDFFAQVKTVWDETRVLVGEIGEQVAIARRSGKEWFVGAITNETGRALSLPLDFLTAGTRYRLRRYEDKRGTDGQANLPLVKGETRINISTATVQKGDAPLSADLAPNGGIALWFTVE
jgi:alpha-glucosidase